MKKINCLFLAALLVLSAGCKKGEEPLPEDYFKITTLAPDEVSTTGASLYAKYESGNKYREAERGIYVSGLIDEIETTNKIVCGTSPEFAAVLLKLSPNSAYSYYAYAMIDGKEEKGETITFYTYTDEGLSMNAVDLGIGVLWAESNIGAALPQSFGERFAWGETVTKEDFTYSNYTYSDKPKVLPREVDVASVRLGGAWRMPVEEDAQKLVNECNWEQTVIGGVTGYKVSGKKEGYTDNWIFLPLTSSSSTGAVWCASYNDGWGARCIHYSVPDGQYEGQIYLSNAHPSLGLRVRAVCDRDDALRPQE